MGDRAVGHRQGGDFMTRKIPELCRGCEVRKECDYVPSRATLIRCLDRKTKEDLERLEAEPQETFS